MVTNSGSWLLDTSVFLRALFSESPATKRWLNEQKSNGARFYASRLLEVEARRAVLNNKLLRSSSFAPEPVLAAALGELDIVAMSEGILDEAAGLRVVLRAADAIHVATALALGADETTLVTHDTQMASAAISLGLLVFDPVSDDLLTR